MGMENYFPEDLDYPVKPDNGRKDSTISLLQKDM